MKHKTKILFIIFFASSLIYCSATDIKIVDGIVLPFDNEIEIKEVRSRIITNGIDYVITSTFSIVIDDYENIFVVYLNVNKEISQQMNIEILKRLTGINEVSEQKEAFFGKYESILKSPNNRFNNFMTVNELHITRFVSDWVFATVEDMVAYYFDLNGFYDKVIFQFYNIWKAKHEEVIDLSNEYVQKYPDRNDQSIVIYNMLDKSMKNIIIEENTLNIQYGSVNDNRVRVRDNPNLDSNTLGYVNTGDEIFIFDKSTTKMKIGDMDNYWYKILVKDSLLLGWAYGEFIDFTVQ